MPLSILYTILQKNPVFFQVFLPLHICKNFAEVKNFPMIIKNRLPIFLSCCNRKYRDHIRQNFQTEKEATGIRISLYRIPNRKDKNFDVSASRLPVTTG